MKTLKEKRDDKFIKEILKNKENIFPKEIIVKFKTRKGKIVKIPATRGTVYYEKKDVLKIIRILKGGINKNGNKNN